MNKFLSTLLKKRSGEQGDDTSFCNNNKTWLMIATRKRPENQRTWQSTRNKGSNGFYKRGAYRGNNKDKNSLQGNLTELGDNVYQYGTRDQGGRFTRTTEAIANYVGRDYSKVMGLLVKNQEEMNPKNRQCRIRKRRSHHP
jgi:hypothetical protein